eukprot:746919-Hanusia_phi.AAC.7
MRALTTVNFTQRMLPGNGLARRTRRIAVMATIVLLLSLLALPCPALPSQLPASSLRSLHPASPPYAMRLRGGSAMASEAPRMVGQAIWSKDLRVLSFEQQIKFVRRGAGRCWPSTPAIVFYHYKGYVAESGLVFADTFAGKPATATVDERGQTQGCKLKAIESALKRMRCGDRALVKVRAGRRKRPDRGLPRRITDAPSEEPDATDDGLVPPNATVMLVASRRPVASG